MESISPIQNCKSLSELELNGFDLLKISTFYRITKFDQTQVSSSKLTDLDGLKNLNKLEELDFNDCTSLIEMEQLQIWINLPI